MRIAVIGHGASMEGARLGSEIDAHDVVIRLHDCHWQDAADYGTRYHVGVLPGPWLNRALPQIQREPEGGWYVYTWDGRPKGTPPQSSTIFDLGRWRKRFLVLGATCTKGVPALTRGLSAVIMAAESFPGSEITGFGLDNVFSGDNETYRYPGRVAANFTTRHDMRIECALLPEIAHAHNCRIEAHENSDHREPA